MDLDLPIFVIEPVNPSDMSKGWVVKSTHRNGVVETSVVYKTETQAKAAAEKWTFLDEDWEKI